MQSDGRRAGQRSHAEAPALELHRSWGFSKSSPISQLVWGVGPWATEEVVLSRALTAYQHAKFYGEGLLLEGIKKLHGGTREMDREGVKPMPWYCLEENQKNQSRAAPMPGSAAAERSKGNR